jgi:uncharacterized protein YigA (DUF484 family)
MGMVVSFEERAVATLRARVAEVEEANQDLIAFARGHSGAVSSIHAAVLAAIEADGLDHLIHVVTQDWPDLLGVDAVALALHVGETGIRADANGLQFVDRRVIARIVRGMDGVVLHNPSPLPCGLIALGQRAPTRFETRHGSELLAFLGATLARTVGRWLLP